MELFHVTLVTGVLRMQNTAYLVTITQQLTQLACMIIVLRTTTQHSSKRI